MSLKKLPLGTRITKCKRNGLWLFAIKSDFGWQGCQNKSFRKGLKAFLKLRKIK